MNQSLNIILRPAYDKSVFKKSCQHFHRISFWLSSAPKLGAWMKTGRAWAPRGPSLEPPLRVVRVVSETCVLTCKWKRVMQYDVYIEFPKISVHNVQIRAKFSDTNFTNVCPVFCLLRHFTYGGVFSWKRCTLHEEKCATIFSTITMVIIGRFW